MNNKIKVLLVEDERMLAEILTETETTRLLPYPQRTVHNKETTYGTFPECQVHLVCRTGRHTQLLCELL